MSNKNIKIRKHKMIHYSRTLLWLVFIGCGLIFYASANAQNSTEINRKNKGKNGKAISTPKEQVNVTYHWKLDHIYPSEVAWKKDFEKLKSYQGVMSSYKNNFSASGKRILEALQFRDQVNLLAHQLEYWARKRVQQSINDATRKDLVKQIGNLYQTLSSEQVFVDSALMALGQNEWNNFIANEPGLAPYKPYFDNLMRTRSHSLSPDMASLLAVSSDFLESSQTMFKAIKQDLVFAPVKDGNGNLVPLSGNYVKLMESENSMVRKDAYTSRMKGYFDHKNTLAMALSSEVNRNIMLARAQGFTSCLDWALMDEAVPREVFTNFLAAVNKNVPALQKWLNIRRNMLGLDSLTLADDYMPIQIPNTKAERFDYDESLKIASFALAPLGENYIALFKKAQTQGWVDVYPSPEKDPWPGSASMAIGVHPYVLLNWDSTMFALRTLVHEMGHAISMNYMAHDEPFLYQRWWYCTSEVPSTCNEILLLEYLQATDRSKEAKLALLADEIERSVHLLFNLGLESEFELAVHSQVENGGSLSTEWLLSTYNTMAKKYYGSAISLSSMDGMKGILDLLNNPWGTCYARYVYSLGYCASQNLANRLIAKEPGIEQTYRRFLGRGRAHYPIEALKEAGIDFTSTAPFEETLNDFAAKVDQFENILKEIK
jgi:oligoendopeptidase F